LHQHIKTAKENIARAQQRQSSYANRRRRPVSLRVGDLVLLSTQNLKLAVADQTPKLMSKFIGPFTIKRIVNNVSYELDLPSTLRVHPVFHASLLKPYQDGSVEFPDRELQLPQRPPPDILPDGEEAWEVEIILDERMSRGVRQYYVKWLGFPSEENTWEPEDHLQNAQEKVRDFHRRKRLAARQ
jgi:hypothetical protein